MKILIANDGYGDMGGVHTYMETIVPELIARGHEVRGLYYDTVDRNKLKTPLADIFNYSVKAQGLDGAFKAVGEWKPDVCYSQNMRFAEIEAGLLAAAPTVKFMHSYYGTCISSQKMHSFPSRVPCGKVFGPTCLLHYYPRRCGRLNPMEFVRMYSRNRAIHEALPEYRAIVVGSGHMREEYIANGANPARVHSAPLFAPPINVSTQPSPLPMSPAKIVFLGRLTPLKGGDHLIQAVAMASKRLAGKIQVIICGDGQPRAEYEAMARSLGVDVVFEGWVSPERREQILNAATLLGLPSLWPEPFGLVGLEAAVYSVPAVAYDVGGISEWLHDGVNGWLAPGDPPRVEGLAEAIEKALSDSARLQEAGRQALAMAKSMSLARHLDQLETILKGAAR